MEAIDRSVMPGVGLKTKGEGWWLVDTQPLYTFTPHSTPHHTAMSSLQCPHHSPSTPATPRHGHTPFASPSKRLSSSLSLSPLTPTTTLSLAALCIQDTGPSLAQALCTVNLVSIRTYTAKQVRAHRSLSTVKTPKSLSKLHSSEKRIFLFIHYKFKEYKRSN